ncbi:hypothetical protein TSUD_145310 [Trifolium subterraneum]|uniref:Uncharacterized protein n=1 Tax=Trifolium subterraneum TaxID=3900 RepID=A0A2Z6MDI0_TRISU|nr:hypothetical protein TSUD_145310 [Trifolium subterraneum]
MKNMNSTDNSAKARAKRKHVVEHKHLNIRANKRHNTRSTNNTTTSCLHRTTSETPLTDITNKIQTNELHSIHTQPSSSQVNSKGKQKITHLQTRTTINLLNKFSAAAHNIIEPTFSNSHPYYIDTSIDEDDADTDYFNQDHVQSEHQNDDLYQDADQSNGESNSDDLDDDLEQQEDQTDDESDIEVVPENQAAFQGT